MCKVLKLGALFSAVFALSACTDFTKYTKEGAELAAKYKKDITTLVNDNSALMDRFAKLPSSLPGLDELKAKITANTASIAGLKMTVEGLSTKIAAAVKAGSVDEVNKVISSFKTEIASLPSVSGGLQELTNSVAALEAKAKEMTAAPPAPAAPAEFSKNLASGVTVKGNPNGVESQVVAFIENPSKPVDKNTWFNFDRLNFKTNSAELDVAHSKEQLTNIANIMKAYPKVKLKIGGYTDNAGKPAANKKLSEARAKNVAKMISSLGVPAKRMSAEGYGPEHPVCAANDTDACKAQNRRIALRVTSK